MKINADFVVGVAYIAFMVGMGFTEVGKLPDKCGVPYTWELPLTILVLVGFPFLMGIKAGRE